jgi:hypothetical protein
LRKSFFFSSLVSKETSAIASEYTGLMQRHWTCSKCSGDFLFNLQERMEHEVNCALDEQSDTHGSGSRQRTNENPLISKTDYFCAVCKKTLSLSSVDILKHKKTHSNN